MCLGDKSQMGFTGVEDLCRKVVGKKKQER